MREKITLVCFKCWRTYQFSVDVPKDIKGVNFFSFSREAFNGNCGFCKTTRHLRQIDTGIATSVIALNRNGLKTDFSCEGHAHKTYMEAPYISFTVNKDHKYYKEIMEVIEGLQESNPESTVTISRYGFFNHINISIDNIFDVKNTTKVTTKIVEEAREILANMINNILQVTCK